MGESEIYSLVALACVLAAQTSGKKMCSLLQSKAPLCHRRAKGWPVAMRLCTALCDDVGCLCSEKMVKP